MQNRRSLLILVTLSAIPARSGQQLPPVYFNHAMLFMEQATLDDLVASPFLKEEFSAFNQQTTQRDGGKWNYTGIYVNGLATYLEFLPALVKGQPPAQGSGPLGAIGFGMWLDERGQLRRIRDSLAARTHTKPEIRVEKLFRDGHDVTWYDATQANFPDDNNILVGSWVMAIYADYLKQRYPDLKPEEDGTTREKAYARKYSATKLLHEITRFTMTVNTAEEEQLAQEFASYGWAIREDGKKRIAAGPEFELEMISAPQGSPRKLAIEMKLNRAKAGQQTVKIGNTSELRFHGDSATWYFPKLW